MHPNPAFRWKDQQAMRTFAAEVGFGMLVVTTQEGPRVVHVPFVLQGEDRLLFHVARGNAVAKHITGGELLFVINGPDGYISPDYYGIPDQVPTWNYVALELSGHARTLDAAELVAQADALSETFESRLSPKPVWTRAKMAQGSFEKMLGGIIGFEFRVTDWKGTLKLGQNKSDAARLAAAEGAEHAGDIALAHLMRNVP